MIYTVKGKLYLKLLKTKEHFTLMPILTEINLF